jgi:hypothetical protein
MAMADLPVGFAGRRRRLFGLALGASMLTVLTLGLYRFWMKTRLRRFYWSAIKPGGHPLEYVGEPLEKLLGFLVAVVLMAFYIGIVNLILMFASYAIFQGSVWAYFLSFLGVIPIIFFAQYRARRYVLARTRWRGLRFGVEPAAWGYAWRALLWWLITIVTLGLLWPRMTFALEKFRTDRTFYGQARFRQGGNPWMLMAATKHIWIGLLLAAIGTAGAVGMGEPILSLAFGLCATTGWLWTLFGFVYYQVDSFRRLTAAKTLDGIGLTARPRPWRVLRHYVFGYLLTFLCLAAAAVPVFVVLAIALPDFDALFGSEEARREADLTLPGWAFGAIGAALYFLIFIFWGVFRQVFVGLPNLRHYAETLTLTNAHDLADISQRAHDAFAEAEGFADALDVGAAI